MFFFFRWQLFIHSCFPLSRRVNKKSNIKGQTQKLTVTLDDGDDEGLSKLIPDIQRTCIMVQRCTNALLKTMGDGRGDKEQRAADAAAVALRMSLRTVEQRYIDLMKTLQFGEWNARGLGQNMELLVAHDIIWLVFIY